MKTSDTAIALILALAATPALAQDDAGTRDMVRLGDHAFSSFDADGDGGIDGGEFVAGLHLVWSGGGDLDRMAYEHGWSQWFGEGDAPAFDRVDADGDGSLSSRELASALGEAAPGDRWRGADDGVLTREEFDTALTSVVGPGDGTVDPIRYDVVAVAVGIPASRTAVPATGAGTADEEVATAETGAVSTSDPGTVAVDDIVPLSEFVVGSLYPEALSADAFMGQEVYGAGGEEIGDVEDIVIDSDGNVISVIAEVGGFWDIGDTHVSIPWTEVVARAGGGVMVPVTEDTVDEYGLFAGERPDAATLSEEVRSGLDDEDLGPRAWRVSELVGDYARLRMEDGWRDYGYVEDVLIDGGRVVAAVVNPDSAYGIRGPLAYPWRGYGVGWTPGSRYYDLPYTEDEVRGQRRMTEPGLADTR